MEKLLTHLQCIHIMSILHLFAALLVATIWGLNFIFIKLSLGEISPIHLCALRFALTSIPAIFFIKRPTIPFKIVISYGLVMFALQFALLFLGLFVGMTAGIASILMQLHIFFSLFFAAFFLGEKPSLAQIGGGLISLLGIGVIAMHFDNDVSFLGFLCILGCTVAWAIGNIIIRKNKGVNLFSLVIWGCFIALFPMIILSIFIDGPERLIHTYHNMTSRTLISVLYISYMSTLLGYGVWNWLLSHNPINIVAPFTLLVPVIGMISSTIILHEPLLSWKISAGLLMLSGLCINIFSTTIFIPKNKRREPLLT